MFAGIWAFAAVGAEFFQVWRSASQARLRSEVSGGGAALVRYLYGFPMALLLVMAWPGSQFALLATPSLDYLLLAAGGALAQMTGTFLLILSFGHRGFVAGTAFSKTEVLQAALFSASILGERLSGLAWSGILIGLVGVFMLALTGRNLKARELIAALAQPAALAGLGAGANIAIAAVLIKAATAKMAGSDPVGAALSTLAVVTAIQTSSHLMWALYCDRATVLAVFRAWRTASQVGILSALGSALWFIAFAMAPVALVRIVGQVEILFTIAFARLYLSQKVRSRDLAALGLVTSGTILVLLDIC